MIESILVEFLGWKTTEGKWVWSEMAIDVTVTTVLIVIAVWADGALK